MNYMEIGVFFGGAFLEVLKMFKGTPHQCVGFDLFEDHINDPNQTHVGGTANRDVMEADLRTQGYDNFYLIMMVVPMLLFNKFYAHVMSLTQECTIEIPYFLNHENNIL